MNTTRNQKNNLVRNTWTKNSVFINTKYSSYGKQILGKVEINFSKLNVQRGGFLEQVIRDLPSPIHPLIARTFSSSLDFITSDITISSKLSTLVSSLNYSDIWLIYQHIEIYIKTKNYKDPYALYIKAVQPFKGCHSTLSNGQLVRDIQFRTSFKYNSKDTRKLISERYDEGINDSEMAYPLSLILNDSKDDLEQKSVKHLQTRLDRLSDVCIEVIQSHLENVSKIKAFKNESLRSKYTSERIKTIVSKYESLKDKKFRVPEADKLSLYLSLIEEYELYKHQELEFKYSFSDLNYIHDDEFNRLHLKPVDFLLSDYYLPRNVVFACLLILLIETGWNPSTLLTLTKDRIDTSLVNKIKVVGIKTKTDQIQEYLIDKNIKGAAESWPYKCVHLLLDNFNNIERFSTGQLNSIFLCKLNRTGLISNVFESISHIERDIEVFCNYSKIPIFKLKDIRDQKINLEYMKSGKNPYTAMVLLGHKDLSTTSSYLNTNILRVLSEANINEFMRRLGDTILFAGGIVANGDDCTINEKLLFPVSSYSDKSIADEWINSIGKLKIIIGRPEIEHCAMQMQYYKESIPNLKDSNKERFLEFHIPRILFCIAMYKFILESEYRGVLRAIERSLNNG